MTSWLDRLRRKKRLKASWFGSLPLPFQLWLAPRREVHSNGALGSAHNAHPIGKKGVLGPLQQEKREPVAESHHPQAYDLYIYPDALDRWYLGFGLIAAVVVYVLPWPASCAWWQPCGCKILGVMLVGLAFYVVRWWVFVFKRKPVLVDLCDFWPRHIKRLLLGVPQRFSLTAADAEELEKLGNASPELLRIQRAAGIGKYRHIGWRSWCMPRARRSMHYEGESNLQRALLIAAMAEVFCSETRGNPERRNHFLKTDWNLVALWLLPALTAYLIMLLAAIGQLVCHMPTPAVNVGPIVLPLLIGMQTPAVEVGAIVLPLLIGILAWAIAGIFFWYHSLAPFAETAVWQRILSDTKPRGIPSAVLGYIPSVSAKPILIHGMTIQRLAGIIGLLSSGTFLAIIGLTRVVVK